MLRRYLISLIYLLTALVFSILAFVEESEVLEVVLANISFVISKNIVWLAPMFLFILFWGIALLFELSNKPMNRFLFGLHFLATLGGIIGLLVMLEEKTPLPNSTEYSMKGELQAPPDESYLVQYGAIALYVLVAAQAIFLINILYTIFRKRKVENPIPVPHENL
ncbi:hypothetical protein D3C87_441430 [compost metagenome]